MKKLLLLLIIGLFFTNISKAQNQYYLKVDSGFEFDNGGIYEFDNGTSDFTIRILDENNQVIDQRTIYDNNTDTYSGMIVSEEFFLPERPHRISSDYFYCFSVDDDGTTSCNGENGSGVLLNNSNSFESLSSTGTGSDSTHYLEAALIPLLNANNLEACEEDILFSIDPDNPMESISGLTWEFYHKDGYWENTNDEFSSNYPLNNTVIQVLESEYPSSIEGNLLLRIRYNPPGLSMDDIFSDFAIINILTCSPQLVLPFTSTDTKCSYSQDGGFHMNLDRDLDNEELVVTLYEESNKGSGNFNILLGQKDTTTLIDNGNGTYSYQWPDPIFSGNYKVKYQAHAIGGTTQPWESLEFSPEFTINNPPPMEIDYTSTNINCHGGEDGSITLTVKGGSGGYRYFLNNGSEVLFTNTNIGTDASPVNHTITNLSQGTKTIKVQDANNCTEKE